MAKLKLSGCKLPTRVHVLTLFMFAIFTAPPLVAADGEKAILILDASGSMWGQIDNEPKITIAKRVVNDLLAELPTDLQLGLIAYGHNRKGDCSDIEELATVGAERATIEAAISNLNPKGKTPMADAVKMAAEKLRYTEDKATVVLISDGIETCTPDPCSAAASLELAGVDFTAHVIGFDVNEENDQAQLRCIAENTGGKFISAGNAEELGKALQSTVVAVPDEVEANLSLRATELIGGKVIDNGLNWTISPAGRPDDAIVNNTGAGSVEETVTPGTYDITVERPADGLKGSARGVNIAANSNKTITIPLEVTLEATLAVEANAVITGGSNIAVAFTGPERPGDYISIAAKGKKATNQHGAWHYVTSGNPATLRLPVEPGDYEIRYVLGQPYRVLAKLDQTVKAAAATLNAQESATINAAVPVQFTGPTAAGDFITITKPDADTNAYTSYAYTSGSNPASITMPLQPGEYELRFVQGDNKVLTRRPIRVVAAAATLRAPAAASAGESVKIIFDGPKDPGNFITVTAPDAKEDSYGNYASTTTGSPADLTMPLEEGNYELRYVIGNKKVIARKPVTITPVKATLDVVSSAPLDSSVEVTFDVTSREASDYISIAKVGSSAKSYTDYAYVTNGSKAALQTPEEVGDYEIRYIQGNKKILTSKPIEITATQ